MSWLETYLKSLWECRVVPTVEVSPEKQEQERSFLGGGSRHGVVRALGRWLPCFSLLSREQWVSPEGDSGTCAMLVLRLLSAHPCQRASLC